jgi:hypothetical protein
MLWVSQAWTEILIVAELVRPVRSAYFAKTVLVWTRPFFVESLVITVITYPEKLKKSVSIVDSIIGEYPE